MISLPKYTINLAWFILIIGGISLFDHKGWAILGLILLLQGLLTLLVALSNYYLNKPFQRISEQFILKSASVSTGLLLILHLFLGKKGLKWELAVILALCGALMYYTASVIGRKKAGSETA